MQLFCVIIVGSCVLVPTASDRVFQIVVMFLEESTNLLVPRKVRFRCGVIRRFDGCVAKAEAVFLGFGFRG